MAAAALTEPSHRGRLALLLELTKFKISAASTFTAAMGYIAALRGADHGIYTCLLGILLLAMAASALNQVQEWELDARMERTRHRPVPSGAVSPQEAGALAVVLSAAGFLTLLLAHGWSSALLGLLALLWYNGLYTPLKRVSAFAVVPGSVIGALPPAIGWAAAGGDLRHPALLALCFVFFVWQVPHFWLLSMLHGDSYRAAGFPTLERHFDGPQILRLIFTWTCATVAAALLLPVFRATTGGTALVLLGLGSVWMVTTFAGMLGKPPSPARIRRAFMEINVYALLLMTAVIADALGAW